MIESDTIKLLKEADQGIKMGISSIDDVLEHIDSHELKEYLISCKKKHIILKDEIEESLKDYGVEPKEPNGIIQKMSSMKTNVKLTFNDSCKRVADLMIDGCNMGIKSLSKYLNEYRDANEASVDITKRLINLEEELAIQLRKYL